MPNPRNPGTAWFTFLSLILLLGSGAIAMAEENRETSLIPRVLSQLRMDGVALRELTWVETAVLEKRDAQGAIRHRTIDTEEIFFEGEKRLRRPLSVDMTDDSNSLAIVRREESRFMRANPAQEVKRNPFELENLIRCFQFTSQGEDALGDRPVRKVAFRAIDGCLEDNSRAIRILQNLSGTLWVEESSAAILRIEGHIETPVTFGFGILGRINSFELSVDREAVSPGVWAVVRTDYRARGRSFIFNRFDVRSTRYRSAFAPFQIAGAAAEAEQQPDDKPPYALRGRQPLEP
jgi:hypothetical protein